MWARVMRLDQCTVTQPCNSPNLFVCCAGNSLLNTAQRSICASVSRNNAYQAMCVVGKHAQAIQSFLIVLNQLIGMI